MYITQAQDGYTEQCAEPEQSSTNTFLGGNWNNFTTISDDLKVEGRDPDRNRNNLYILPSTSTATNLQGTSPPSHHPTSTIALPIVSPLPLYDDDLESLSGRSIHAAQLQFHFPASSPTSPPNALGLYFNIQGSDAEPAHYPLEMSRGVERGIHRRRTVFSDEPSYTTEIHGDLLQGIGFENTSAYPQQHIDGAMLSHGGVGKQQLRFDWTRSTGEITSSERSLVELHEAQAQDHNQSHKESSAKSLMPVVSEGPLLDTSRTQIARALERHGQAIVTRNDLNSIPVTPLAPSSAPKIPEANATCNQRRNKRKADDDDHADRQASPSKQTKRQKVIDHASQAESPPCPSSSSMATTTRRYRLLKPKRASTPILYAARRINRTPAPPPTASTIHLTNPWSNETVTRENMEYPCQITRDAVLLIDPWKRRTETSTYMECPPQVTNDAVLLIDPWMKRTETTADLGYKSPPTPSDAVLLIDPWKHRKETVAGMESHQPPTVAEHPLYGGQWMGSDELNRTGSGKTWLPVQNTYLEPTFALGGLW